MRKETIIKYEKEFIAWCKGDRVLKGFPTSMSDRTLIWQPVTDFTDWRALDTTFIIDNEYSIFAKALAEGKTIQGLYINPTIQLTEWINSNATDMLNYKPEHLRIKPEEPQFKVGDFVRNKKHPKYIHSIIGITEYRNYIVSCKDYSILGADNAIKWTPQAGELCWFTDSFDKNQAYFGEYNFKNSDGFLAKYTQAWKYCEPFLNSKPSWFKD